MTRRSPRPVYDASLMVRDMAARGWHQGDLAKRTGLSSSTITRFLQGRIQMPRAAAKMAKALDRPLKRYVLEPTPGNGQ